MKHLQRAFDNQNQIGKYVFVFIIAFFVGQIVGAIPLFIILVSAKTRAGSDFVMPENSMDFSVYGIDANLGLILMLIPFAVTLLFGIWMIKSLHRRSFMDVVNGGGRFRWRNFFIGASIWGVLMIVSVLVSLVTDPENLEFQFNPKTFIPLLVISVLLLPIQSGTEEFLMRGYLAQGVAARTRSRIWVIIIPSVVFALLHAANPEIKEFGFWLTIPQYLLFGIFLAVIAILDDGIEVAIGLHSANNVLSAILVTSKSSVLQTPALFFEKESNLSGQYIGLVIAAILALWLMNRFLKWDFKSLFKRIEKPEEEVAEPVTIAQP